MLCSTVCYAERGDIGMGEYVFIDAVSDVPDEEGLHVIKGGKKVKTIDWRVHRTKWGVYFEDKSNYYFTGIPDASILAVEANNLVKFPKTTDEFSKFVMNNIIESGRSAPQKFKIAPKIPQVGNKPVYLVGNWIIFHENKNRYTVLPRHYVVDEAYSATTQDIIEWLKIGKMPDLKKTSAFWCPACSFYAEAFHPIPEFSEESDFIELERLDEYTYVLKHRGFECKVDSWYKTVECSAQNKKVSVYGETKITSDNPLEWIRKIAEASSYVRIGEDTKSSQRTGPSGHLDVETGNMVLGNEEVTRNIALGNPCGIGGNFIGEFTDEKNGVVIRGVQVPTARGTVRFPDIVDGQVVISLNGKPLTSYGSADDVKKITFISYDTTLPKLCYIARSLDDILPEVLRGVLSIITRAGRIKRKFSPEDEGWLETFLHFGIF